MPEATVIDDQPISATFFGEGRWLTDFITPNALDIKELYRDLTKEIATLEDKIATLHNWVASQIRYTRFVKGRLWIEGKSSIQDDLWNMPSITARIKVGNCVNKAFLMTSLLRQTMPLSQVHCVLGNLYNGKPGGHAWVQAKLGEQDYIIETTRADVPSLIPAFSADRYETVHLFNDEVSYAIEGRTMMEPMTACFSTWLSDYLNWAYINRQRSRV